MRSFGVRRIAAMLSAALLAVALCAIFPSFSWLGGTNEETTAVNSGVKIQYFERGEGTQENPFIIHEPRHLYNLAWLQYLGRLNQKYYFALCADNNENCLCGGTGIPESGLDMTGIWLPPIGTSDNPFIGDFEGNGKTITNLKVSNSVDDLNKSLSGYGYPGQEAYKPGDYLGVFGEITSGASVKNVRLDAITVTAANNTKATMGLAVGYVDATISGIGVSNSTLSIGTDVRPADEAGNVSNYSLVGYASSLYLGSSDIVRVTAKEPSVTIWNDFGRNNGSDWGNSIAMKDMYSYLSGYYDNAGTQYTSDKTISLDYTDTSSKDPTREIVYNTTTINRTFSYYNDFKQREVREGNDIVASFSFDSSSRNSGTLSVDNPYYLLLYGKDENYHDVERTVTTIRKYADPIPGFLIKKDGSEHYLSLNATKDQLVDQTSSDAATIWSQDVNGHLFTVDSITNNSYYLNAFNNITASESGATVWQYSEGRYSCNEGGNTFFLVYDSSNNIWKLAPEDYWIITDGQGNYLSANESQIINSRDQNRALKFFFQNTSSGTYGGIASTIVGQTTHNLLLKNNQLYLDTIEATLWEIDENNSLINGANILRYDSSQGIWTATLPYYWISYGGNYLSTDGTSILTTTNKTQATQWFFSVGADGPVSANVNNTSVYLGRNRTGGVFGYNYNLVMKGSPENWTISDKRIYNNLLTSVFSGYSDYFVRFVNNSWEISTSSSDLVFTSAIENKSQIISFGNGVRDDNTLVTKIEGKELPNIARTVRRENAFPTDTWFPLGMGNYKTSNTGYVISGGSYSNVSNNISGDIRVSKYAIGRISSSYQNNALTTIWTIDADGLKTIDDANNNYQKYSESKGELQKTINNDTSGVYGLHFMNAKIDANDFVTADKVTINGKTYYDYQLPRHCIDFTLKEKGYINFFAGNYFNTGGANTNFFSLHQIHRNPDGTIASITKIEKIYANDDGSYDYDESKGRTPIFDTAWIGNNGTLVSNNRTRIFYFEIPVNPGEYALGSVEGGNGAYLLYLDISANAQQHENIYTEESFTTVTDTYQFPIGVDFVPAEGSLNSVSAASAAVTLGAGESVTFSRTGNTVTASDLTTSELPYVQSGVTVTNGSKSWSEGTQPAESESHVTKVDTLRDYNTVTKIAEIAATVTEDGISGDIVRYEISAIGARKDLESKPLTDEDTKAIENAQTSTSSGDYYQPSRADVFTYRYVRPTGAKVATVNSLNVGQNSAAPVLTYDVEIQSSAETTVYGNKLSNYATTKINNVTVSAAQGTDGTPVSIQKSNVDNSSTTYRYSSPVADIVLKASARSYQAMMTAAPRTYSYGATTYNTTMQSSAKYQSAIEDITDASQVVEDEYNRFVGLVNMAEPVIITEDLELSPDPTDFMADLEVDFFADYQAIFGMNREGEVYCGFPPEVLEIYEGETVLNTSSAFQSVIRLEAEESSLSGSMPLLALWNSDALANAMLTISYTIPEGGGAELVFVRNGVETVSASNFAGIESNDGIHFTARIPANRAVELALSLESDPYSQGEGYAINSVFLLVPASRGGKITLESVSISSAPTPVGALILQNTSPAIRVHSYGAPSELQITWNDDHMLLVTNQSETRTINSIFDLIWEGALEDSELTEETLPEEATEPIEETEPTEATEPVEETEPTEPTEETESPIEETEPPKAPVEVLQPYYYTRVHAIFGQTPSEIVSQKRGMKTDFRAKIYEDGVVLDENYRLTNPENVFGAVKYNLVTRVPAPIILLENRPAHLNAASIVIRYAAGAPGVLGFNLGSSRVCGVYDLVGVTFESDGGYIVARIPTTPVNLERMAYCMTDADGCVLTEGEAKGFVVAPASTGGTLVIESVTLNFTNEAIGTLNLCTPTGFTAPYIRFSAVHSAGHSFTMLLSWMENALLIQTDDMDILSVVTDMPCDVQPITPDEPEETIPEENPEEPVQEETVPEETEPEEPVPEEPIPEETVPPETIPEETIPTETVPEETQPEPVPEETEAPVEETIPPTEPPAEPEPDPIPAPTEEIAEDAAA